MLLLWSSEVNQNDEKTNAVAGRAASKGSRGTDAEVAGRDDEGDTAVADAQNEWTTDGQ